MRFDERNLRKPPRKLRKLIRSIDKQPATDDVHDLRTNARRMQVTASALGWDHGPYSHLLESLEGLRKRAGKVRDMDVLTADVASIGLEHEKDCIVSLLEYLGHRRFSQAQKLGLLANSGRKSLAHDLKRFASDIGAMLDSLSSISPAKGYRQAWLRAQSCQLEAFKSLSRPAKLTPDNLHEYRLRVKEVRYLMQMAHPERRDDNLIDLLERVQDAIGEWHDWESLIKIAARALAHGPGCELVDHIRSTAIAKYDSALQLCEELRSRYAARSVVPGERIPLTRARPARRAA